MLVSEGYMNLLGEGGSILCDLQLGFKDFGITRRSRKSISCFV